MCIRDSLFAFVLHKLLSWISLMKTWTKNLVDTWSAIYGEKKTFRKLWQLTSRPVIYETPANRPHESRRPCNLVPRLLSSFVEERRERTLGMRLVTVWTKCGQWRLSTVDRRRGHVTQSDGVVVRAKVVDSRSLMRLRNRCSKSQQLLPLLGFCRKREERS